MPPQKRKARRLRPANAAPPADKPLSAAFCARRLLVPAPVDRSRCCHMHHLGGHGQPTKPRRSKPRRRNFQSQPAAQHNDIGARPLLPRLWRGVCRASTNGLGSRLKPGKRTTRRRPRKPPTRATRRQAPIPINSVMLRDRRAVARRSNTRPPHYECGALPAELRRHFGFDTRSRPGK